MTEATMTEPQLARASMAVDIVTAEEDGDRGIVEAIVSAYNVTYRMGFFEQHTIEQGAFADSIEAQATIPLFWMHAWDWTEQPPIGTATASEVTQPKPGLKVAGEMWLDEPHARPVFRALKAGALREWSIGYRILEWRVEEDDEEASNKIITKAELLEASSVLRGANPGTETLKVASLHPGTVRRIAEAFGVDAEQVARLVLTPDEIRVQEGFAVDVETSTPPVDEPAGEPDFEPADEPADDMDFAARLISNARTDRRARLVGP